MFSLRSLSARHIQTIAATLSTFGFAIALGATSAQTAPLQTYPFAPQVQQAPQMEDEGSAVELPARFKRQVVTYTGPEAPGTVIIDCSTAIPSSTVKVAEAVTEKGGRFLDAPMTRTPKEAAEGRLNLLVGGDKSLFEECKPILACFAENIAHAGPVGAGHRMKLLHNYVSLGAIALLSEAAACALRADIDPAVFAEVLTKGGGGGVALERLKPYLLEQDPSSLRFFMSNAQKDLSYYNTMAAETGAVREIGAAVLHTYDQAVSQGGGERYVPELVSLLKDR